MFLQDAPPDTSAYMIAGYAAFFVLTAIYLVSLAVRSHNLHEDLKMLETMQEDNKDAANQRPAAGRTVKKSSAPARRSAKKAGTTRKKSSPKAARTAKSKRKH